MKKDQISFPNNSQNSNSQNFLPEFVFNKETLKINNSKPVENIFENKHLSNPVISNTSEIQHSNENKNNHKTVIDNSNIIKQNTKHEINNDVHKNQQVANAINLVKKDEKNIVSVHDNTKLNIVNLENNANMSKLLNMILFKIQITFFLKNLL